MGIQGFTWVYKGIQGFTRVCRGIQGITWIYGLLGCAGANEGVQGIIGIIMG